jgi:Holliday junction DNA helicase RuvA
MILELKDKMLKLSASDVVYKDNGDIVIFDSTKDDALSALINLGYKSHRAREVVDKIVSVSPQPLTLDVLLKKALKILAG